MTGQLPRTRDSADGSVQRESLLLLCAPAASKVGATVQAEVAVENRRLHSLRIHGLSADYAGAETSIGTEPLPKSLPERHVRPLDFSVSLPRNIGFPEPLDFGNRVFTRF